MTEKARGKEEEDQYGFLVLSSDCHFFYMVLLLCLLG